MYQLQVLKLTGDVLSGSGYLCLTIHSHNIYNPMTNFDKRFEPCKSFHLKNISKNSISDSLIMTCF